jgi:hypothetical protein
MKTKMLRNMFISVVVLFALTRLLAAGTSDGVLNFNDPPLCHSHPTFITFDPPGGPARDMLPSGINPRGTITGTYVTGFYPNPPVLHAFLREPDGTFTTIDPPGSTGAAVAFGYPSTQPINPAGAITGDYFDASGASHGFLRAPDGTFTRFDPPGSTFTIPQSINAAGAITGFDFDASGANHGFLRAVDGTLTTFDAPDGVGTTAGQAINSAGTIVGFYSDANFVPHGFVRDSHGTITEFDVPDATYGTQPTAINAAGTVTGSYVDANFVSHGFVRARNGTITRFDPPESAWTSVGGINPSGAITGSFTDENSGNESSFVRSPNGTMSAPLDVPGSPATFANVINPAGVITGEYFDAINVAHGFLRIP